MLTHISLLAQVVSLQPVDAGPDDEVTVIFDATQGYAQLKGASKVYMHHGVVIESASGIEWKYTIGNWGKDDGVGEMTRVPGEADKWQITLSPNIREYFEVPSDFNIFRLAAVFRNNYGSVKGTSAIGEYPWGNVSDNGDYFINLNLKNFVSIIEPFQSETYHQSGDSLTLIAKASENASTISMMIDDGNGYVAVSKVSNTNELAYTYYPTITQKLSIKVIAVINADTVTSEKSHTVVMRSNKEIAALPGGLKPGINYHANDQQKATLVLEAPGKDFAYVVGDFNNWLPLDNYLMKQTPDGEFFWLELDDLVSKTEYVFQYWIDGTIKVGDPYADKVADPWNDKYIPESVYPNLPDYQNTNHGIATVLQTGQQNFEWSASENNWQRPNLDNLIIYELLVRDFLDSHSFTDLSDTLDYLMRLGVNAIELMPVSEFEGNESWGYNPSYYFAPDKYYGTKDDLKTFIETAHQKGIAVIMDMVLNHAYGSNPMVKMYWDPVKNAPATDNPWFNTEYVGFYQWGYDFNHESAYTQAFVDRVNMYWLEEFHVDGFRFDYTKGFTNYSPGGSIDGFDQSRINILKRMADQIRTVDSSAYIILEHWGQAAEENILGSYGMKMWSNRNYDFKLAITGQNTGNFVGLNNPQFVTYFDSHDEQRLTYFALTEGFNKGLYDIQDSLIMMERAKMAAAFNLLQPGTKMIWQFDELGYDVDINYKGRIGVKPLPWGKDGLGYYEDENRQKIYKTYQALLRLREEINPEALSQASTNYKEINATRRLSYDCEGTDLVVIGNFDVKSQTIDPVFSEAGTWFDYFTGEEITVSDVHAHIELAPGEWHVYTSNKLSDGLPGVVNTFDSPVTITPEIFTMDEEIAIEFDASKAWNKGTAGLIDADQVLLQAGLVTIDPNSNEFSHQKSQSMTNIGDQKWRIVLTPADFFDTDEAFKLGMYFTNEDETKLGMGFQNSIIFTHVLSLEPIVRIEPAAFQSNEEISILFDARQGNRRLMGANKVYMHSGVATVASSDPASSAWNHVIGNWGKDDGVGEMTKIQPDIWQINIVPEEYYGISESDFVYWVACVFRSADGTTQSGGAAGEFENGLIDSKGDIFVQNQLKNSINDIEQQEWLYPNPTNGFLNFSRFNNAVSITLMDTYGRPVLVKSIANEQLINVAELKNGIYIYRLETLSNIYMGRLLKR